MYNRSKIYSAKYYSTGTGRAEPSPIVLMNNKTTVKDAGSAIPEHYIPA